MYSPFEKQIFKEIIGKFDSALKNDTIRGNRPEAREDRNKLWDDIENEFNSVQGVTQRTIPQLKKLLQNLKTERKEVYRIQRQNAYATGGGPPIPSQYPDNDIMDNNNFLVVPIEGTVDSDQYTGFGQVPSSTPQKSERKSDDRDTLQVDDNNNHHHHRQEDTTSTSPSPAPAVLLNSLNQEATSSTSISDVPLDRLKRNIGPTGKKRKQGMIQDEFDARCKRVLHQIDHDLDAHTYLLKKLNHETNLAKVLTEKAQIEKEMAENRKIFEKKKQEMELKFLEAKYKIDLDNLKK